MKARRRCDCCAALMLATTRPPLARPSLITLPRLVHHLPASRRARAAGERLCAAGAFRSAAVQLPRWPAPPEAGRQSTSVTPAMHGDSYDEGALPPPLEALSTSGTGGDGSDAGAPQPQPQPRRKRSVWRSPYFRRGVQAACGCALICTVFVSITPVFDALSLDPDFANTSIILASGCVGCGWPCCVMESACLPAPLRRDSLTFSLLSPLCLSPLFPPPGALLHGAPGLPVHGRSAHRGGGRRAGGQPGRRRPGHSRPLSGGSHQRRQLRADARQGGRAALRVG